MNMGYPKGWIASYCFQFWLYLDARRSFETIQVFSGSLEQCTKQLACLTMKNGVERAIKTTAFVASKTFYIYETINQLF